jgi:hypothetical protein
MSVCFCGCGTKVGAFKASIKSANGVGRTALNTASSLREKVLPFIEANPNGASEEAQCHLRDKAEEALRHSDVAQVVCAEVVHGGRPFSEVDWPEIRSDLKEAVGMDVYFRRHMPTPH